MRIFLFRGLLGDAYSTGINQLADKLARAGHKVTTHRWFQWRRVQRQYLAEFASAHSGTELAVIGHSLGANSALKMANSFAGAGLSVRYVATMDPTVRQRVHKHIAAADNFRSRDIRDKPIAGAVEYGRNDLSHTQIDKDLKIHSIVVNACGKSGSQVPVQAGGKIMESSNGRKNKDVDGVLVALSALLNSNGKLGADLNDGELPAIMKLLAGETSSNGAAQPAVTASGLTQVNAALGPAIGKALDGRKTAIGIIGLLATSVLPMLFPQLAPVLAILKAVGLGGLENIDLENLDKTTEAAKNLPNILTPIFSAFASWGILGKIEKWVTIFKR